jgi:hypothetical protein
MMAMTMSTADVNVEQEEDMMLLIERETPTTNVTRATTRPSHHTHAHSQITAHSISTHSYKYEQQK